MSKRETSGTLGYIMGLYVVGFLFVTCPGILSWVRFWIEKLSNMIRISTMLQEYFGRTKYQQCIRRSWTLSLFGGIGERLLADKVGSCLIYAQLRAITHIRNQWDQIDFHIWILGADYYG